jgi:FMN phosphatase YigB (HAD superfamily)
MKPDVVVFDLGKVLLDFDYGIAAHRLAASAGKPVAEIQAFIDQSPLLFRFETGRIDRRQFYQEVCAATGFRGSLGEFADCFSDIFTAIEDMVALNARLRRAGVPTFIFSNTNDIAIGHIRRNFPFFAHFHGYVLSYEHGAMKPDPKLYAAVESMTGRAGGAILYVDDRPENIETGAARGWRAIRHQSARETILAVNKLGLPGTG